MIGRLVVLAATLVAAGAARDREFEAMVRGIETRYNVQQTRIPLMGLVNFFLKVARPAGTSGLRLAVFENAGLLDRAPEFHELVGEALGSHWQPFVRVESRRENESTAIYSRLDGKRWELTIATLERNEVSLVRVRLNTGAWKRWLADPARMGKHRGEL